MFNPNTAPVIAQSTNGQPLDVDAILSGQKSTPQAMPTGGHPTTGAILDALKTPGNLAYGALSSVAEGTGIPGMAGEAASLPAAAAGAVVGAGSALAQKAGAAVTQPAKGLTITHVVTQHDLDNNQVLRDAHVKVGESITTDAPDTLYNRLGHPFGVQQSGQAMGSVGQEAMKGAVAASDFAGNTVKQGTTMGMVGIPLAYAGGAGVAADMAMLASQGIQGAQDLKQGIQTKDPVKLAQAGTELLGAGLGAKGVHDTYAGRPIADITKDLGGKPPAGEGGPPPGSILSKPPTPTTGPNIFQKTAQAVKDRVTNYQANKATAQDAASNMATHAPEVQAAVKAGIPLEDANVVKNSSLDDKVAGEKMTNIAAQQKVEKTGAHPLDVVGQTLSDLASHVVAVAKNVGQQIGNTFDTAPKTPVDVTAAKENFITALKKEGVTIPEPGAPEEDQVLDFSSSKSLSGKGNATTRDNLQNLYDNLRAGNLSPQEIQQVRGRLANEQGNFNQVPTTTGIGATISNVTRGDLKAHLLDQLPGYAALAKQYAQATGALRDYNHLIGEKWNGRPAEMVNLRAGEIARRLDSNASADTRAVFKNLEEFAQKNGYSGTGSVYKQGIMANLIADIFGVGHKNSLRGQVAGGVKDVHGENAGIAIAGAVHPQAGLVLAAKKIGSRLLESSNLDMTAAQKKAIMDLIHSRTPEGESIPAAGSAATEAPIIDTTKLNKEFRDSSKTYMIASAENPMGAKNTSPEENAKQTAAFEQFLTQNNIPHVAQKGKYGGPIENSFLIKPTTMKEVKAVDDYLQENSPQQENILVKGGEAIRYDPRTKDARGADLTGHTSNHEQLPESADYYSEINGKKYAFPLYNDTFEHPVPKAKFNRLYSND